MMFLGEKFCSWGQQSRPGSDFILLFTYPSESKPSADERRGILDLSGSWVIINVLALSQLRDRGPTAPPHIEATLNALSL